MFDVKDKTLIYIILIEMLGSPSFFHIDFVASLEAKATQIDKILVWLNVFMHGIVLNVLVIMFLCFRRSPETN